MKLCECNKCGKCPPIAKKTDRRWGHVKGQPIRFVHGHSNRFQPGTTIGHRFQLGHPGYINCGNLRHGEEGTREYETYGNAKQRCTNPRTIGWRYYGGRGIRFLFARYEDFIACLGPRPQGMTLDRINNDGHYEPGNVRWATRSEQRRNQRPPQASRVR